MTAGLLDAGRLRAQLATGRSAAMSVGVVPEHIATTAPQLMPGASRPHRIDRHAAVLVPLVSGPQPGVLLTRRASTLRLHAGEVAFPGGRIDPTDASPEAASLREAEEEIGLQPASVELVGRLPEVVTGTYYHVTPVVGLIPPGLRFTPAPGEVECVFVMPLDMVCDPRAPQRRQAEIRGAWHSFWVWPHQEHYIWGFTAALLVELAAVLNRSAPQPPP